MTGCEIITSGAAFLSASHRNMIRAGLGLLHAQALWTPSAL